MKFIFPFIGLFLLLCGCSEDRSRVGFPQVVMSEKTIVEDDHVIVNFLVDYLNGQKTEDFGIIYRNGRGNEFQISLGNIAENKTYNVTISRNLIAGLEYEVKAYVKSNSQLVYSNPVTFVSNGGYAPKISNVFPLTADLGDTIQIRGQYFADQKENNRVKIGQVEAAVIYASDSLLKVTFPEVKTASGLEVLLTSMGKSFRYNENMNVVEPQIDSIVPSRIIPGKEFRVYVRDGGFVKYCMITGKEMGFRSANNNYFVGNISPEANEGTYYVRLIQFNHWIETTAAVEVCFPVIESVTPQTVWYDDILTIRGKNLDLCYNFTIDYSWEHQQLLQTDSLVQIKVRAPFSSGVVNCLFKGHKINATQTIKWNPPVVASVIPGTALYTEEVKVTGTRFFKQMGCTLGDVVYINENEVFVYPRWNVASGTHLLQFSYNGISYPAINGSLTIPKIEIQGFSKAEVRRGEKLSVFIRNLPARTDPYASYSIQVGGINVPCTFINNSDHLEFSIPNNHAFAEYPEVTVNIGAQVVSIRNSLRIIDEWSPLAPIQELVYSELLSTGSQVYGITNVSSNTNLYVFDSSNRTWNQESSFTPLLTDYWRDGIECGGYLYFWGGLGKNGNSLLRYSLSTKQWLHLGGCPLVDWKKDKYAFCLDETFFIGNSDAMFAYNEGTGTWNARTPIPGGTYTGSYRFKFSYGHLGYVAVQDNNFGLKLWEYNANSDSWQSLSFNLALPAYTSMTEEVQTADNAYILYPASDGTYHLYEFNLAIRQLRELQLPGMALSYPADIFIRDGKLYVTYHGQCSSVKLSAIGGIVID